MAASSNLNTLTPSAFKPVWFNWHTFRTLNTYMYSHHSTCIAELIWIAHLRLQDCIEHIHQANSIYAQNARQTFNTSAFKLFTFQHNSWFEPFQVFHWAVMNVQFQSPSNLHLGSHLWPWHSLSAISWRDVTRTPISFDETNILATSIFYLISHQDRLRQK